jgi:5,10-methylenetetrahydrofolate reductase
MSNGLQSTETIPILDTATREQVALIMLLRGDKPQDVVQELLYAEFDPGI